MYGHDGGGSSLSLARGPELQGPLRFKVEGRRRLAGGPPRPEATLGPHLGATPAVRDRVPAEVPVDRDFV